MTEIKNLQDLCDHFGAKSAGLLNQSIYLKHGYGASISVRTPDKQWWHRGQNWHHVRAIEVFTIQNIEGVTPFYSDWFLLPVSSDEVDRFMEYLEDADSVF